MGEAPVHVLLTTLASLAVRAGGRLEMSPEDYAEAASVVEDLRFTEADGGVVVTFAA